MHSEYKIISPKIIVCFYPLKPFLFLSGLFIGIMPSLPRTKFIELIESVGSMDFEETLRAALDTRPYYQTQ